MIAFRSLEMSSTGCSCADSVGATDSATLGRHLSSCMIGPAASASSLLNEWLLIRTLQLARELPDPLPSPAPVQYAMVLPSLQLLSFIVCRNADATAAMAHSTSSRYDHGAHDVVVTVRDCRIKRVWRMRQCYGPKRAVTTAATVPSTPLPSSPPLPSSTTADDRFYTTWLSSRQQHVTVDDKSIAATTTATASASAIATSSAPLAAASSSSIATAAPATTAPTATAPIGSVTSSFSSNLRTAIAAARAKSPPFASSLGPTSSSHSTWKAAAHPFSLFDAWGEAEAWLNNQQHNVEHEQYMRCIREQMATCAQQPPQAQPTSLQRPSVEKQATEVGDGWSELHALLHHLGFFSSLLPTHAGLSASALFPYSLPPTTFSLPPSAADVSRPSLLLLHPSTALNDSIDELDAISDDQLHRVMILTRRPQQSSEWEMLANRCEVENEEEQAGDDTGKADDDHASREAFSSLVAALADLSSHSRLSEQLVWFVSSRLCPMLLSEAAETSLTQPTDAGRPSVWTNLLSACPVRVVWCEGEADYVSPHRQRQKDRRQKRLARETGDGNGTVVEPDMLSRSSSPHNSPDAATMPSAAFVQPPCPTALVYVVVSFHPADATYRVRVDCDWRLRNKQRRVNQQQTSQGRSQSHSNAIISSRSAGGAMHSTRWLPPPLLKSNSLTNAHPPPPPSSSSASLSSASTGTVIKSLFKRLGSRRSNGQPSDHLSVNDGPRSGSSTVNSSAASSLTSSLSPARSSTASSSLFGNRRSPRRGHISKQDSEAGAASSHNQQQHHNQQQAQQQAARRRSERADALRRHPVLSQPFPPSDCFVGGVDSLAARLSDTVLLSARRVHAWREWRSLSRRRQQVESHSREGASRRSYDGEERAVPLLGPSSAADVAMDERCRLLREIVRDHGELVTPAAFLESLFGQRVQDAPALR